MERATKLTMRMWMRSKRSSVDGITGQIKQTTKMTFEGKNADVFSMCPIKSHAVTLISFKKRQRKLRLKGRRHNDKGTTQRMPEVPAATAV